MTVMEFLRTVSSLSGLCLTLILCGQIKLKLRAILRNAA